MSDYSSRYFQLTPDIMIEYNYALNGNDGKIDASAISAVDVITTSNPYMKFFVVDENYNNINLDKYNFVIPTNKSETSFVGLMKEEGLDRVLKKPMNMTNTMSIQKFTFDTDGRYNLLTFDKIRFHFTSRRFMDSYDSLIFQAYFYNMQKQKIALMSFRLAKTDDLTLNQRPLLINDKYYTSYIDVKVLSVAKILDSYNYFSSDVENYDYLYGHLRKYLEIDTEARKVLTNTPIMFNVYGVKHELKKDGHSYYITESLNKISIPSKDKFDDLYVDISEATDGDYFKIQAKVSDGTSFPDYMYKLGSENLNAYIVLYELALTEYYVPINTTSNVPEVNAEITHKEHFMINVASGYKDGLNTSSDSINEEALQRPILYRPIVSHDSECFKFMIEVDLKIINTTDNTTVAKKGSLMFDNPSRYGKRMNRINLTETPPIVNVYNKRTDSELGNMDTGTQIKITNNSTSSGITFENVVQNTVSYVDVTNVVVSVQSVAASSLYY